MLFHDSTFLLIFLPIAFLTFAALSLCKRRTASMLWLTGASLAFYAIGSWAHLLIFVGSIAANYHLSLAMGNASSDPKKKKTLFITGIALNLGILFLFKYLNFTTSTLESLTGLPLELPPLTLPLAISFFTFQQIAYLSMIFRSGHDKANALEYVLYVSFFL